MDTVICPRCGTENRATAMNCKQCRINLKFAFQNPQVAAGATQNMEYSEPVPAPRSPQDKARDRVFLCFLFSSIALAPVLAVDAYCRNQTKITYGTCSEFLAFTLPGIVALLLALASPVLAIIAGVGALIAFQQWRDWRLLLSCLFVILTVAIVFETNIAPLLLIGVIPSLWWFMVGRQKTVPNSK